MRHCQARECFGTCNAPLSDVSSKLKRLSMGWLRLVGSLKLQVSFAKEPYKTDYILQKGPIILRSLLIVATPYTYRAIVRHQSVLVNGMRHSQTRKYLGTCNAALSDAIVRHCFKYV